MRMKLIEQRGNVTVISLKLTSFLVPVHHPRMPTLVRTHMVCHIDSSNWHHLYLCYQSQVKSDYCSWCFSHFSNQYQRFILVILCLETVLNLLLVSLMDPGYVLDESDYEDEIDRECPVTCSKIDLFRDWHLAVCNHHVPYGSEHCQDCCLCVVDRDHHCGFTASSWCLGSWLGKCIGRYNMKYFSSFCFFVVISAAYLGITNFPPLRALIGSFVSFKQTNDICFWMYSFNRSASSH